MSGQIPPRTLTGVFIRVPTDHTCLQEGRYVHRSILHRDGDFMKSLDEFHAILAHLRGYLVGLGQKSWPVHYLH